jgi:hypothetical protein
VVAVLVNACAVLLIGLMLLLVYGDISKRIRVNKAMRAMEREAVEEAAKAAATNAPAPAPAK